jgi:O-methyltransferase involved in polyketide biosynthesis
MPLMELAAPGFFGGVVCRTRVIDDACLPETLAASGHDADLPTLVLCEGVTQYLPRTVVDGIFAYAGSLPTGSRLVFTYLPTAVLDDPEQARRVRRFHWQTGFDPADVSRHLADRGLTLTRDWDADQYRELLLRPLHRDLKVFEIERLAIADTP